jgi:hypothetical protein
VRICDTKSIDSESIYSKANSQKSGWRQKSLSNIDLSLSGKDSQPGAGAFRYRDFEAHDDLCIKNIKNSKNIEIQRDYEDVCNINPKGNDGTCSGEHHRHGSWLSLLDRYSSGPEARHHSRAQQGALNQGRGVQSSTQQESRCDPRGNVQRARADRNQESPLAVDTEGEAH